MILILLSRSISQEYHVENIVKKSVIMRWITDGLQELIVGKILHFHSNSTILDVELMYGVIWSESDMDKSQVILLMPGNIWSSMFNSWPLILMGSGWIIVMEHNSMLPDTWWNRQDWRILMWSFLQSYSLILTKKRHFLWEVSVLTVSLNKPNICSRVQLLSTTFMIHWVKELHLLEVSIEQWRKEMNSSNTQPERNRSFWFMIWLMITWLIVRRKFKFCKHPLQFLFLWWAPLSVRRKVMINFMREELM